MIGIEVGDYVILLILCDFNKLNNILNLIILAKYIVFRNRGVVI